MRLGGSFQPYEEDSVQHAIESAFLQGSSSTEITVRGVRYRTVFGTPHQQISTVDSSRVRPVQRIGAQPSSAAQSAGQPSSSQQPAGPSSSAAPPAVRSCFWAPSTPLAISMELLSSAFCASLSPPWLQMPLP